jgi:hypothetical protein
MKLHRPDSAHARKPGETAENHRTRLLETAPHLARKTQPKLPHGSHDVRSLKISGTGLPPVKGGKNTNDE